MTAGEALAGCTEALRPIVGEDAAFEARQLISHILGVAPGALPLYREETLSPAGEETLQAMLKRRRGREPLQYILGEWAFMGLPIRVRPGALIPRADTETLAEQALFYAKERGYQTALDLCCGTGCIGIALAKLGGLSVSASDISQGCIALARENAETNDVPLTFFQGSYFAPVTGRYDLIVSNPPYIETAVMDALAPELSYEPRLALDGGEDGLVAYRAIRAGYQARLNPGGMLLLEVGAGQARAVAALFGACAIYRDLNGIERVVRVDG